MNCSNYRIIWFYFVFHQFWLWNVWNRFLAALNLRLCNVIYTHWFHFLSIWGFSIVIQMQFCFRGLMYKSGFDTSFVGFKKDGAQWLVDNTDIKLVGKAQSFIFYTTPLSNIWRRWTNTLISLVGTDYLSVAAFTDATAAHLVFLKSKVSFLSQYN